MDVKDSNALPIQNDPPTVSIGMPVYNGEKYISNALDSLLAQTFKDFELIISDNASTDTTSQLCLEYAKRDPRIRYHRNDVTTPVLTNFNHLLKLATGKYFMWAAHDDMWEPTFIEALVHMLESAPEAVLAFSGFDNIDEEGRFVRAYSENWGKVFSQSKYRQFASMILFDESATQKANHVYGLIRKDKLLACGGLRSLPNADNRGEDILTLLRLLGQGQFATISDVLFHYRVRSLKTFQGKSVASYILNRTVKRTSGHQGNLLLFFSRNHAYHSVMRHIILNEIPLPLNQRILLWAATIIKELWRPIKVIPLGILHEFGILKRS